MRFALPDYDLFQTGLNVVFFLLSASDLTSKLERLSQTTACHATLLTSHTWSLESGYSDHRRLRQRGVGTGLDWHWDSVVGGGGGGGGQGLVVTVTVSRVLRRWRVDRAWLTLWRRQGWTGLFCHCDSVESMCIGLGCHYDRVRGWTGLYCHCDRIGGVRIGLDWHCGSVRGGGTGRVPVSALEGLSIGLDCHF